MVHRFKTLFLTCIVAIVSLGGAAAFAQDRPVVRVAVFPCTHCVQPWLLPEHLKEHDIEVEVVRMRRYQDIQVALATNNVDIGNIGYSSIPLMAAADITNVKLIAGISDGGQGLMLKSGTEATEWTDLHGLRIGVSPNSVSELLFKSTVKHFGGDPGKIDFVSFTTMGPEVLQAVSSGEIDGFVGWEPVQAQADLAGIAEYSDLKLEAGPAGNPNGALAVTDQFREANPEIVAQVVEAMVAITDELNANQSKWVEVATPFSGDEAATRLGTEHASLTYRMPQERIEELSAVLVDAGVVELDEPLNVLDFIDYSFLADATGMSEQEIGRE